MTFRVQVYNTVQSGCRNYGRRVLQVSGKELLRKARISVLEFAMHVVKHVDHKLAALKDKGDLVDVTDYLGLQIANSAADGELGVTRFIA